MGVGEQLYVVDGSAYKAVKSEAEFRVVWSRTSPPANRNESRTRWMKSFDKAEQAVRQWLDDRAAGKLAPYQDGMEVSIEQRYVTTWEKVA